LDFTADRATTLFAVFGVFFLAAVAVRLAKGFLACVFEAADFEVAALGPLRLAGFDAAARFALGRTDLFCIERPLREDVGDARRVAVCDLDPLMPLVTELLIRWFKLNGAVGAL
jgi:hypothetical protein